MKFDQAITKMKYPGEHRPGVWRGSVLQVKVTNACDLDCNNCSVAVGFAKALKQKFFMTPDQFRTALRSLRGYDGVIGMFGGNPCIHPDFPELCQIFKEEVPDQDQRGLWSNRPFKHAALCRDTFSPTHSNLNVHGSQVAWDEFKAGWPEAKLLEAGRGHSRHSPIFGSPRDVGVTEDEMWEAVSKCYVNQTWSAAITVVDGELFGYFCEIAATMAEITNSPGTGYLIIEGWYDRRMPEFSHQVQTACPFCLIPMNAKKIMDDEDSPEVYTDAWATVMVTVKGRHLAKVDTREQLQGDGQPATKYLERGVMPKGM